MAAQTNGERNDEFELSVMHEMNRQVQGSCCGGDLKHSELDAEVVLQVVPVKETVIAKEQLLESSLDVSNQSLHVVCDLQKTSIDEGSKPINCEIGTVTMLGLDQVTEKGLAEEKKKQVLDRSDYSVVVTSGQRKYGGPPLNWIDPPPTCGSEIYCGKIPYDMNEDELIPFFEKCGRIWELRLIMDPLTNLHRGFAFVTFASPEAAQAAVSQLNEVEIKDGRRLRATVCAPNLRLFVGNIPKCKGKSEIFQEASKATDGLLDAIVYSSPEGKWKNRGFCFLDYDSNKSANKAMHRLSSGRVKLFGSDVIVDWADPQEDPDTDIMAKVKVLYVRNLTKECSEEKIRESFDAYGPLERVKKIKDYAFVHFEERDDAVRAMKALNGCSLYGATLNVTLSKPPGDKKKKEEMLRARERRLVSQNFKFEKSSKRNVFPVTPVFRGTRLPIRRGGIISQPSASSASFGYNRGILTGLNYSNYHCGSYPSEMDNYCSNGDVPFSSGHKIVSIHGEREGRFASVVRGVGGRRNGVRGASTMDCRTPPHSSGSSLFIAGRGVGDTREKWRGGRGQTGVSNSNQENY